MLSDIISSIALSITFLMPTILVSFWLPKRSIFLVRAIISIAVIVGTIIGFNILQINVSTDFRIWISIIEYFLIYVLLSVCVFSCFECNFWAALFCGTAGYCIQHFAQRLYGIFVVLLDIDKCHFSIGSLLGMISTAVVCVGFYFLFLRQNKLANKNIMVDNKFQIITAAAVVTIVVFVNTLSMKYAYMYDQSGNVYLNKELMIYIYIFSIVSSFLALMVEYGLLSTKAKDTELIAITRILNEEREQYLKEKENINIINIKCHDLKHQIMSLEGKVNEAELAEVADAIGIFDSSKKTGNEALDVILTQKSLQCYNEKIRLTCLVDGRQLNFIPEHELYSLFGNAIDNAIDNVKTLEQNKRLISISQKKYGESINISIENYFNGEIKFANGLPETQKDKNFHGFGMKSMKHIVEKYDGNIYANVNGNIFTLDIFLPAQIICE